jgi:acetolactate synthase-1/2/3 large subunit
MKGAQILVRCLTDAGVDKMAVLCGNGLNPILYEAARAGMRLVDTRNEQAASYIADAYARLTGKLGLCAVSSAVGHTNALIGVLNAHFDGAPLLLLSGASSREYADQGVFQELDHIALAGPICKYARLVERPENLPFYVHEAIGRAISGRPGPVHLTVPLNVLEADVPEGSIRWLRQPRAIVSQRAAADPDLIRDAAQLLLRSKRPVLVAGTGLFYAQAGPELAALAGRYCIPVVTPIWDRGVVEGPQDWFLGVIGAASGQAPLLPAADLVIIAGAQVDYRLGYAQPPTIQREARIIRISAVPEELRQGVEPDVAILADPRSALRQLAAECERLGLPGFAPWLAEAQERDREFRKRWLLDPAPPPRPMTGRHIVEALRPFLRPDTIFLIDGGNIGQWAHMVLAARRYPSTWLTCGASAVVGWGLPGAMGARLAYPDKPIILLSGDGAFTFTVAELERAAAHELPFVVVLADDCAWGIVVSGQCQAYGEEGVVCSRTGPIDYVRLAEACGCIGIRVESPAELAAALEQGLQATRPVVIHVPIAGGGPAD